MNSTVLKSLAGIQRLKGEGGQNMVEYGLIVALIALGATVSIRGVASGIGHALNHTSAHFAAKLRSCIS